MTGDEFFPLGDRIPGVGAADWRHYRARWTGAIREPKAGEWYLSGAIITAYRAPNDLGTKYHIAKIVKVKVVTMVVEEGDES